MYYKTLRFLRLVLLIPTLVMVILEKQWIAFGFLGSCLVLGALVSKAVNEREDSSPLYIIWSRSIENSLTASIIGVILFQMILGEPTEPLPVSMIFLWSVLLIRLIAYPIFAYVDYKSGKKPGECGFWGHAARLTLLATTMILVLRMEIYQEILIWVTILMGFASAMAFMYRFYRDPTHRKPLSIASQLTVSRIVLTPFFILVFFPDSNLTYHDNHIIFKSLALFMVVSFMVTDFLDGYLARKMNDVSTLGKYLDPFSDKISNMTIFLCFMASGYAHIWMVAAIYFREASVETLRTLAANKGVTIDARRSGKWKTALQGVGVLLILVGDLDFWYQIDGFAEFWDNMPLWIMGTVTVITLGSGIDYFVGNKKVLREYV